MNTLLAFTTKLFFVILLGLYTSSSFAQVDRTFWFAAPDITVGHGDNPILMRFATFATPSVVTISMPSNGAFIPIVINMAANTVVSRDLTPFLAQIETPFDAGGVPDPRNTGILVQSTADITAYYEVNRANNPDIFALKGVNALGRDFYLPFQKEWNHFQPLTPLGRTGFVVVATVDNTVVTVTPTLALEGGRTAGVPYNITLNRGQSYCGSVQQPMIGGAPTGTRITATQAVAVTMFHDSIQTGSGGCYDLAGDQLIPVNITGKEYSVQRGFLGSMTTPISEQVIIVATEANTTVIITPLVSSVTTITLTTAGDFHKLMLPAADLFTYITSNKNIYVAHYAGFGCEVGAAILPPLNCTGSRNVRFVRSSSEYAGITLLVKAGSENKFSFNGGTVNTDIPAAAFANVPGAPGWRSARIELTIPMLAAGAAGLVSNSGGLFHLGLINGAGSNSGCRYGYFSSFNSVNLGPDITIAYGSTVTLDAGPNGLSYSWNTTPVQTTRTINVAVYLATSYTVTVDIGGCLLSDAVCVGTSEYVWTGFEDTNFNNINNWSRPCGVATLPHCGIDVIVPIPANLQGVKAILNINSTVACRDLWIETDTTSKGRLDFSANGRLNICRHFRHDGIMNTVPNSTIAFIGNVPQRYMFNTARASGEFENLIIANTTTPISNEQWPYVRVVGGTRTGNMIVSTTGSLTFQSGYIETEGIREIIVKNRATNAIVGHNLNKYVVGRLRRHTNPTGAYDYPVGLAIGASNATVDAAKTGTLTNMDPAPDWVIANYCTGIGNTRALDFDGVNDFIQMPVFTQLSGNQPRTIEMWANVRSFSGMTSGEAGLFTFGNTSTLQDFSLRVNGSTNNWLMQHWGGDDNFSTAPGLLGNWAHYAVTYDGTQVCVYINGTLIQCNDRALNSVLTNNFLARWRNGYLNGQIDEVRIWNYARSVSEIANNRCLPIARCTTAGLIAHYDFEEGTGTSITHKNVTCIAPTMTYQLANINFNAATNADNFLAFFTKYGTVPTLSGQPLSCTADFNCQVLNNGFWTINAFSNPTTQITGAGVTGNYGMTLYNRDYTNGLASCNMGPADKGTIMKRADNASAWGIANGFCTDFNLASTARRGMTGFSDFATAKTFMPVLLPVELLSFTATYKGKGKVQTQWETISEKDVDKFVVERSTNGIDFITIGTEKVTANSYSLKSYTLDDPKAKLGINYYRLKTIDLDGTIAYSKIVAVTVDAQNTNNLLTVYPNPTPIGSEINIEGIEKAEVRVQITTTLGQVLYDKASKHEGGTFSILHQLAAGVYFVKIGTSENLSVMKIIIE